MRYVIPSFGPVVNIEGFSPKSNTLLVLEDANMFNLRFLPQWVNMGQADTIEEFQRALMPVGIPYYNSIAATKSGDVFYGDISVTPNVSQEKLERCVAEGELAQRLAVFGIALLSGLNSDCEWENDKDAPEGLFGFDSLPKIASRDYVANANDSYWLTNPDQLLEGFPQIIGRERVEQSLRTRQTFIQAQERIIGSDGFGEPGFSVDNMRAIMFSNRNLATELMLEDLVKLCKAVNDWSVYTINIEQANQACDLLANWDGVFELKSVGPHIFTEFWVEAQDIDNLWVMPFDATNPLYTPNTLNVSIAEDDILKAMATGVNRLVAAGIEMDIAWGQIQFVERNGERIALHGGSQGFMFNTIEPNLINGKGYTNIDFGNSYIQVVGWNESDCPVAYGLLTYSQSSNPASPHYDDVTRLYSEKKWIEMPFCDTDIEKNTLSVHHIE